MRLVTLKNRPMEGDFMKKISILLSLFGLLAACASKPNHDDVPPEERLPHRHGHVEPAPKEVQPPAEPQIDLVAIQRFLNIKRNYKDLGYSEKVFNTCDVGYGYSKTQNCDVKYFVVSHFRLQCRDSEGTISTILSEEDLKPIDKQEIYWSLNNERGTLYTDSEGYGQIRTVASESQRGQRVKLALRDDFLYLRAELLKQITVPRNWCN